MKPRTDPSSRTHSGFRPTHVKPSGVKARRKLKAVGPPPRVPAIVDQWCHALTAYRVGDAMSYEGLDELTRLREAADSMVK